MGKIAHRLARAAYSIRGHHRTLTLTRHGYTAKVLAELLDTRPGEVRALFRHTLGAERSRELKEQMLAAGLPI